MGLEKYRLSKTNDYVNYEVWNNKFDISNFLTEVNNLSHCEICSACLPIKNTLLSICGYDKDNRIIFIIKNTPSWCPLYGENSGINIQKNK